MPTHTSVVSSSTLEQPGGLLSLAPGAKVVSMDAVLRTGLEWFAEETLAKRHLTRVHQAIAGLRDKLAKLPSGVFFLESPDEPYELLDVLRALGKQTLVWLENPEKAVEPKLLAPQVAEILEQALELRELMGGLSERLREDSLRPLPLGGIRERIESRGEPLPDRL